LKKNFKYEAGRKIFQEKAPILLNKISFCEIFLDTHPDNGTHFFSGFGSGMGKTHPNPTNHPKPKKFGLPNPNSYPNTQVF
jgi:hypothetical protein